GVGRHQRPGAGRDGVKLGLLDAPLVVGERAGAELDDDAAPRSGGPRVVGEGGRPFRRRCARHAANATSGPGHMLDSAANDCGPPALPGGATAPGGLAVSRVAIVGASGAVGAELLALLEERRFPLSSLRLFASRRSAGKRVPFGTRTLTIEELPDDGDLGADVVFSSAGGALSLERAWSWAANGAV